jgi:hypothetical protein|uniref:Uncharacterized protein n=1 Tax=viral metagenome TaxID=1070528 RepID=A0A6C0IYZ4_9ZZZZ
MDFVIPKGLENELSKTHIASSIKSVKGDMKRLFRVLGYDTYSPLPLYDFDQTTKNITKQITKKSTLWATLKALRHIAKYEFNPKKKGVTDEDSTLIKKYSDFYDKITKSYNDEIGFASASKTDIENYVPFVDVVEKRKYWKQIFMKEQKKKTPNDKTIYYAFLKYFILTIYTKIPPLRGQEYCDMIFFDGKEYSKKELIEISVDRNINLWDTHKNTLIITKHKTMKTHKEKVISINSKTVAKIVTQWMIINKSGYVLSGFGSIKQMTPSALAQQLNNIFQPKNVGTSMLRKIYASDVASKKPIREQKRIAKIMGHTIAVHKSIYERMHR